MLLLLYYNYHTYHIAALGLHICLLLGCKDFGEQGLCPESQYAHTQAWVKYIWLPVGWC